MSVFDKFLDAFSEKDLGRRIGSVIAIGIVICAVAAFLGYRLLMRNFAIGVDGVVNTRGAVLEESGDISITVSIDHKDLERLPADGRVIIEDRGARPSTLHQNARITSIDPETGVLKIAFTEPEAAVPISKGAEVKLVLFDAPLWRLLLRK